MLIKEQKHYLDRQDEPKDEKHAQSDEEDD
jgi:hypothetical protein